MMKMKVIWCGTGWRNAANKLAAKLEEQISDLEFIYQDHSRPLTEQIEDVNVLIPTMELIDEEIMKAAPRLELIQQFGVGLERVDLEAANKREIFVANAPGTNRKSVAEAAFYLILALAKQTKDARYSFQTRKLGLPVGIELAEKTLGIVGLGQSGIELAKRAHAFEMRIIAIKQRITSIGKYDFKLAFLGDKNDLDYLLKESDYISIHAPLTSQTRNLFGEREFRLMKSSAYIINVSRGPIIEKKALQFALQDKMIAGAGLDVFWNEPEDPNDPLFRENVITLPHVAGSTYESHERMMSVMIKNIQRLARGEPLLYLHAGF